MAADPCAPMAEVVHPYRRDPASHHSGPLAEINSKQKVRGGRAGFLPFRLVVPAVGFRPEADMASRQVWTSTASQTIIRKRANDRAAARPTSTLALLNEAFEQSAHPVQVRNAFSDDSQFVLRK